MKCRIGFMSNDICQPLFVYQALPRKAVPTMPVEPAAPSNEDTPPGAGLNADPQNTCQTVKAHTAHPADVSTSASPTRALALQASSRMGFMALIQMKCIGRPYRGQVRQASWYKFPVPCLGQENKLLIIFIDVALAHVIENGTLQWKQGLTCNALTQDMTPCLQAW